MSNIQTPEEKRACMQALATPQGKTLLKVLQRFISPSTPSVRPREGVVNDPHAVGFQEGKRNVWEFLQSQIKHTPEDDE